MIFATLLEKKKSLKSDPSRIDRIMKKKEMKFNKNQVKITMINRNKNINPLDLKIREIQVMYLGSKSIQDGRC